MRTNSDSPRRRLAGALVQLAARVMPVEFHRWACGMQHELASVADDREALRWAVGCLRAAHAARFRHLYLLDVPIVRIVGALVALLRAFDATLPTMLTAAYRLQALRATEALGDLTPGDDYRRLVPLMEAIPPSIHTLVVTAGICYAAASRCLLLRKRAAGAALLLGVGVEQIAAALANPIAAEVGVRAAPQFSFVAAVLLPILLPMRVSLAAWSGSRSEPKAPAGRLSTR